MIKTKVKLNPTRKSQIPPTLVDRPSALLRFSVYEEMQQGHSQTDIRLLCFPRKPVRPHHRTEFGFYHSFNRRR